MSNRVGLGLAIAAAFAASVAGGAPLSAAAGDFHAVTPCRVVDTATATPPEDRRAIDLGSSRTFVVAGTCGVPSTAKAVAALVTSRGSESGKTKPPRPFTIAAGASIAALLVVDTTDGLPATGGGIVALAADGSVTIAVQPTDPNAPPPRGKLHVTFDVTGYFE